MPFAKNKKIRVVITRDAGGDIQFGLKDDDLFLSAFLRARQRVTFRNGGHPGVMIYFDIDDRANTGLTFQPVPGDAIWAAPDENGWPAPPACPVVAPAPWSELVPLSVERGGNQLIVYFRNTNPDVHFPFALRFVDPDGNGVNYDPIGDGANGLRA